MWILSFLLLFIILIFGLLFLIGLILAIIGKIRKKKRMANIGIKILIIPIIVIAVILVYRFTWEIFASKPDEKDLVGKYVSTENESYELEFLENGNFELSNIPEIDLCETGKYRLDSNKDEIMFDCDSVSNYAKIDRGFGNYKIQFIIGDPDGGENIYFEKIKK
jgi:hypothetical protein